MGFIQRRDWNDSYSTWGQNTADGRQNDFHPDVKVIFINKRFRQAFDRNNLDLIDILNYKTVRSILSIEDIAQLMYLNDLGDNKILNKFTQPWALRGAWEKVMSEDNKFEFLNVISPLAKSELTKSAVFEHLKLPDQTDIAVLDALVEDGEIFTVQAGRDMTLFVGAENGLLDILEHSSLVKKLATAYLKVLYGFLPLHKVSFYEAFDAYVASL